MPCGVARKKQKQKTKLKLKGWIKTYQSKVGKRKHQWKILLNRGFKTKALFKMNVDFTSVKQWKTQRSFHKEKVYWT